MISQCWETIFSFFLADMLLRIVCMITKWRTKGNLRCHQECHLDPQQMWINLQWWHLLMTCLWCLGVSFLNLSISITVKWFCGWQIIYSLCCKRFPVIWIPGGWRGNWRKTKSKIRTSSESTRASGVYYYVVSISFNKEKGANQCKLYVIFLYLLS